MVIWLPLGTEGTQRAMSSSSESLPSPTSWRIRVATNAFVWLPILYCIQVSSGVLVERSDSPRPLTQLPSGLCMATIAQGARVVARNWASTRLSWAWVPAVNVPAAPLLVPIELEEQADRARLTATKDPTRAMTARERERVLRGLDTGLLSRWVIIGSGCGVDQQAGPPSHRL